MGLISIEGDLTMAKMRAMVVRQRGGPFVAEERDIPLLGPEETRIRVQGLRRLP